MAKLFIEDTTLSAIGDAIREKTGSSDLIAPLDMPTAIGSIEAGGGGEDITEIDWTNKSSGNFVKLPSGGLWDWAIEKYGSIIKFPPTGNTYQKEMFYQSGLSDLSHLTIPISNNMDYMFYGCTNLTKLPKFNNTSPIDITYLGRHFAECNRLREIPYDYFTTKVDNVSGQMSTALMIFYNCHSLRQLPDLSAFHQKSLSLSASNNLYRYFFGCCYALDAVPYMPIFNGTFSSNFFVGTFEECSRVKDIIFATQEDGTPYTVNWKNQTIDLTYNLGWSSSTSNITNKNSGITIDKQVSDDATYQALKDDPDWFSCNVAYSRYNHDSAVATINSLPDTSAYLATQSGATNTIIFKGASGSATDGGAISNLTEEEIAVATAKGWTVQIV